MSRLEQILTDNGCEDVKLLSNYSYDTAFVGVTTDNRAVYDYQLMVEWLVREEGFTEEDAVEWIDYNTLRALQYMGDDAPIVMNKL